MNPTIQLIQLTVRYEHAEKTRRQALVKRHDDFVNDKSFNRYESSARSKQGPMPVYCRPSCGTA